jgi:biotin carboxyl carrier protein
VQYEIEIDGRIRQVQVHRAGDRFLIGVDGREWLVDAARVDGHMWSLLLGRPGEPDAAFASHEVTCAADPVTGQLRIGVGATPVPAALNNRRRWGKRDDGGGTGPQRVLAPMPGKIVRVLVTPGQTVEPRQGLVVVEAMKMENELKAPAAGVVAGVRVGPGEAVEKGQVLVELRGPTPP